MSSSSESHGTHNLNAPTKDTSDVVATFRPDREMFVCMDPTGCYVVSWNAEDHKARMAKLGATHEAKYVLASELVESERLLAEAREAILALKPPMRAEACWCPGYHDIKGWGHSDGCVKARASIGGGNG